jgi:hypothetical protein
MKHMYMLLAGMGLSYMVWGQQAPGGVSSSLTLWLRADVPSTFSSTDSLNNWTYYNNSAFSFASSPHNRPIVQNSTFNFLPSVYFNGIQKMDGPTGANAPITQGNPGYSIFAVWSSVVLSSTSQCVWSQDATNFESYNGGYGTLYGTGGGLWVFNGEYGDQDEISPYTQGLGLSYNPSAPYISEVTLLAQNAYDLEITDQTNIATGPVVLNSDPAGQALTDRNIADQVNRLGCRTVPTEESFMGNLAELIVYNNSVDVGYGNTVNTAKNQIFSYLGMKYGIPLGINLLSSAGTTVWDASANSTYNHLVFGLAVDNASGLSVQQSNSITTGGGNGAGQNGMGNIILSAPSPITTDQSFLMIGTDSTALTETSANLPAAAGGSMRLARNWKVANTNSVGPVNLSFDLTGLTVTGTIGTIDDFRVMVNQAGDPTFATGATNFYQPASFTGDVAHFTNINLNDGAVFGVITNASGSTPLPVNFISFTAQPQGNNVDLSWTVGANQQAKNYVVEHSLDGVNLTPIGTIANDPSEFAYSFVQTKASPGKHFYRILETDLSGAAVYSTIATATIGAGVFSVVVLNNPAVGRSDAQLQINTANPGTAFIELWSAGGIRLSVQQQAIAMGTTTLDLPMSSLPAGGYMVRVMLDNATQVTQVIKR